MGRTLRTWSIADGKCRATVAGANGTIRDLLSLQHDGSVLACGWIRVDRWQPTRMERVHFATKGGLVMCTDSGERLLWHVTADELRLWELAPPADRLRLGGHSNRVVSAINPVGSFVWLRLDAATGTLISAADDAVRVRDTTTWATIETSFLGDHVRCAQMDGRGRIASGTTDDIVRVHEVATGKLLHEWVINPKQGEVVGVAFSPDGERLAISCRGVGLTLRTLATEASLTLHDKPVWEPVFSPDGRRLAVGSFAREVLLFDSATGALQTTLRGHTGAVWTLAFHPRDPNLLVSGSNDGVVCFWDLASERQCGRFAMFDGDVGSVSFGDGGNWLAMSGLGDHVEVWDTTYYDRHIAGNLRNRLDEAREKGSVPEDRAAELTRWADETLARPWPRLPH